MENLKEIFNNILDNITGIFEFINNIIEFIKNFFNMLPSPFKEILIILVPIITVIFIIKLKKGI